MKYKIILSGKGSESYIHQLNDSQFESLKELDIENTDPDIDEVSEILDKKIALIYHEFFPDAKMVISPKFRIEQLLKANKNEDSPLWYLLDKFAQVFNEKEFKLEELHYQSSILSIKLRANNFTVLENLEQQLKRSQIKVSQVQASSHDHDLIATLELSL